MATGSLKVYGGTLRLNGKKVIYKGNCFDSKTILGLDSIYNTDLQREVPYELTRGVLGLAATLLSLDENLLISAILSTTETEYQILNDKYLVWCNKNYSFVADIDKFLNKGFFDDISGRRMQLSDDGHFTIVYSDRCLHHIPDEIFEELKKTLKGRHTDDDASTEAGRPKN